MKNIFKYYSGAIAGVVLLSALACKKVDFGEQYNVNPAPNVTSFANTAQLLTNAELNAGSPLTIADEEAGYFIQWIMASQYPETANYGATYREWSAYYAGPLMDLQTILNYNTGSSATDTKVTGNGSNANQMAIARILKAWYFSIVTDRWGDVPYTSALKLNFNPTYDKQSAIYANLFTELKAAIAQFDGGAVVKGDIMFNGDVAKWKMFANTLRMVLAMRLSKADAVTGKAEFVAAYNDPAGWVNSNTNNLSYTYLNNTNFRSPWNSAFETRTDYGVSNVFVNWLTTTNDMRLQIYAQPNASGQYLGIPFGLNRDQVISWTSANDYSRMGKKIIGYTLNNNGRALISYAPSPGYIFTAAQLWLTVAEAQALGWVGATTDAATSYVNGVKASWEQWGITYTQAQLTAYLASNNVSVTGISGSDLLKVIGYQKWVALYPNTLEGWSEWRRTNYPALTPSAGAINASKKIPVRNAYPASEATLNGVNYRAQVSTMPGGIDTHDVPVWWDK